jgi:hypothetical protein
MKKSDITHGLKMAEEHGRRCHPEDQVRQGWAAFHYLKGYLSELARIK